MISNILISRLDSDGFKIYKQLYPITDKILLNVILEKSIQRNANPHEFFYMKMKRKFLYSSLFTFQDEPTKRPNLYGIHIIADYDLIGLGNVLIYLSKQFQQFGLHQIDSDQFKNIIQGLIYHHDSVQVTLRGISTTIELDWQGKNNPGVLINL